MAAPTHQGEKSVMKNREASHWGRLRGRPPPPPTPIPCPLGHSFQTTGCKCNLQGNPAGSGGGFQRGRKPHTIASYTGPCWQWRGISEGEKPHTVASYTGPCWQWKGFFRGGETTHCSQLHWPCWQWRGVLEGEKPHTAASYTGPSDKQTTAEAY